MLTLYNEKVKLKKINKRSRQQYLTKRYANPYFADRKTVSHKSKLRDFVFTRSKIITAIIAVIILSSAVFLFYTPYFSIATINVQGEGQIDNKAVLDIAWEQANDNFFIFTPQKNIFFYNKAKLYDSLKKSFPIDRLTIEKKLPHTVNIAYSEKQLKFIWLEDGKYFKATGEGSIIAEINVLDLKKGEWPLIENQSSKKIEQQNISIELSYLDYAIRLYIGLKDYRTEIGFNKFLIDNGVDTIKVVTDGPQLYFNTKLDLEKQITKLLTVKRSKLKDEYLKKTYIDLRYGDSIYSY